MDIALTYQSILRLDSRRLGCWKESLIDSEVLSRMTSPHVLTTSTNGLVCLKGVASRWSICS
jgi:hypothetical protein